MKKLVRKKTFQVSPHIRQALLAVAVVLLFIGGVVMQQRNSENMNVQPVMIMTDSFSSQLIKANDRWKDHEGWWGGYWWGNEDFYWKGREWGVGKSAYPWYWEYDRVAKNLNLVGLAKKNQWYAVDNAIMQKIASLEQELRETDNKATKRKLERTIDRLNYYQYQAKRYKKASQSF